VHRDCAQQVHAHRHELLSLQPSHIRPVAASVGAAARDVSGLVQVSLHIRRELLRLTRPRFGDVDKCVGADHRCLYRREIRGDLPSVSLADLVKPISCDQTDPSGLAGGPVVRATAGSAVWCGQAQQTPRYGDVHGQENHR